VLEILRGDRLQQIAVDAEAAGVRHRAVSLVGGQHDIGRRPELRLLELSKPADEFEPVLPLYVNVAQHDLGLEGLERLQRRFAVGRLLLYRGSRDAQHLLDPRPHGLGVFDDENTLAIKSAHVSTSIASEQNASSRTRVSARVSASSAASRAIVAESEAIAAYSSPSLRDPMPRRPR